jgi:single-stranded DNA-binding protein
VFRHVYPAQLNPHVVVGRLQQRSWTDEDSNSSSHRLTAATADSA